MNYFSFLARITTTAVTVRYLAAHINAANEVPLFPIPKCDLNKDLCFWLAEFGPSVTEISVTNCGGFYVYFLQPTIMETLLHNIPVFPNPDEPLPPAYCTTSENLTRGNDYTMQCVRYARMLVFSDLQFPVFWQVLRSGNFHSFLKIF